MGSSGPCAAPSSQPNPWLRLPPRGGLFSVLPSACPPPAQTVPVCLAFAAGWSQGRVPGPPVHKGPLFTAACWPSSLLTRLSPALAIIPISGAPSLLPGSSMALVPPALCWWQLPCRAHRATGHGDVGTWEMAACPQAGKQGDFAKFRHLEARAGHQDFLQALDGARAWLCSALQLPALQHRHLHVTFVVVSHPAPTSG